MKKKTARGRKKAFKAAPQAKQSSPSPVAPVALPAPQPPAPPQRSPEEQQWYVDRHAALLVAIQQTSDHYRYTIKFGKLPEHTVEKARKVLIAIDQAEAERLAKAAEESMFMACLGAWSRGYIQGPAKPEDAYNLAQQATKLESLALMLKKKGDMDGFKDQMMKAVELREKVRDLLRKE